MENPLNKNAELGITWDEDGEGFQYRRSVWPTINFSKHKEPWWTLATKQNNYYYKDYPNLKLESEALETIWNPDKRLAIGE